MLRHFRHPQPLQATPASRTVRVLRSDQELAEASARAAVHARRLHDRLEARAARDAWTAEYRADDQMPWCRPSEAEVAAVPVPDRHKGETPAA